MGFFCFLHPDCFTVNKRYVGMQGFPVLQPNIPCVNHLSANCAFDWMNISGIERRSTKLEFAAPASVTASSNVLVSLML